jgi:hypothetical protein
VPSVGASNGLLKTNFNEKHIMDKIGDRSSFLRVRYISRPFWDDFITPIYRRSGPFLVSSVPQQNSITPSCQPHAISAKALMTALHTKPSCLEAGVAVSQSLL